MTDLEDHRNKIQKKCRLCFSNITKTCHKKNFLSQIKTLYNIDVENEDDNVFPSNVCAKCRLNLTRSKYDSTVLQVHFEPHGADCKFCNNKKGRPQKNSKRKLSLVGSENDSDTDSAPECLEMGEDSSFPSLDNRSENGNISADDCGKEISIDTEVNENYNFGNVVIDSLNVERFCEPQIAGAFVCTICRGVPFEPVVSSCNHIFCSGCIRGWLTVSSACPVCRNFLDETEILPLSGNLLFIYDSLMVKCTHVNCTLQLSLKNIKFHEISCPHAAEVQFFDIQRSKGPKLPINKVTVKHAKHRRLKPIINSVDDFCTAENENKTDVLFALLKYHLKDTNDPRWKDIDMLWHGSTDVMTVEECLALRVNLLQSKGQYKKQYDFLKSHNIHVFQSPSQLDQAETKFLPGSVEYSVSGDDYFENIYKAYSKSEPISILEDFTPEFVEFPVPNCIGVRWSYIDALAKSIQELSTEINEGLRRHNLNPLDTSNLFITTVKDGGDGMGDVSIYKEKSDRSLPDKAFRFSFSIVKVEVVSPNSLNPLTVFEESNPNSVKNNKPLLESIADENNKCTISLCMRPIENERKYLKNKIMKVKTENGWQRHEFRFFNSMVDEKRDRSDSGLQGSGSKFLCTLCDADRESAISNLGSFEINRSVEQHSKLFQYIRINPDKLSDNELSKMAKGVKSEPLSCMEPIQKGIDATHADINLGSFFKKIIVREIACVTKWELSEDVKAIVKDAESRFDKHMKEKCGINPQLMMPGNYARTLFSTPHETLLDLIQDAERRSKLSDILNKFSTLRKVYRSINPRHDYPHEVRSFKELAVEMGQLLISNFEYAQWPNYLHKVIEHTQELIENPSGPGSVGCFSSEGNEAGNKLFRHFRKNLSRRGNTYGSLVDVIKLHWLYSSKVLTKLAEKEMVKNKCSLCYQAGHNRRTCPLLSSE